VGICSEKGILVWFHHCMNIIACTYTNLDSVGQLLSVVS
jgi:hypothetical protein